MITDIIQAIIVVVEKIFRGRGRGGEKKALAVNMSKAVLSALKQEITFEQLADEIEKNMQLVKQMIALDRQNKEGEKNVSE